MYIYKENLISACDRAEKFLEAVSQDGQSVSGAAKRYGFSRRTAYRILVRTAAMAQRRLARIEYFEALERAVALRRENSLLSAKEIREMLIAEGLPRIPSKRSIQAHLKAYARRLEDESHAHELVRKARILYSHGDTTQREAAGRLLAQAKDIAPHWFRQQAPMAFGRSIRQLQRLIHRSEK